MKICVYLCASVVKAILIVASRYDPGSKNNLTTTCPDFREIERMHTDMKIRVYPCASVVKAILIVASRQAQVAKII